MVAKTSNERADLTPKVRNSSPSIHPSTWNRNSQEFGFSILYSLDPIEPRESDSPVRRILVNTIFEALDRYSLCGMAGRR
jgi:hypothetical protein